MNAGIAELATRVKHVAIGHPRTFVGIDGPGAAGKSTLAEQLVAAMGDAYLVHVDDFYLPSSRRHERFGEVGPLVDLPRLAEQVTVPGSAGEALRYQRYDWVQDELAQWIDIPSGTPIVLEGVFCLMAELRNAYTFKSGALRIQGSGLPAAWHVTVRRHGLCGSMSGCRQRTSMRKANTLNVSRISS